MNKFLKNLYQSIFWGGLTREEYAQIKNAAAKKNIVFEMWFAVISIVVYGVLIIINQLGLVLTLNEPIYRSD